MGSLSAQIVNIENKRIDQSDNGFSGTVDFSLNFTRAEEDIFQIGTNAQLQYKYLKSKFLLLSDLDFVSVSKTNLLNNGFQHFRYNYNFKDKPLIWEAFSQVQYNQIQKIGLRALNGIGPRFKLLHHDSAKLALGILYMYEYESLVNPKVINRDHRLSNYFSIYWKLNKNVSFSHVIYYQPLIQSFDDFRVSSESQLSFNINKYLKFRTRFSYSYDSNPPPSVQRVFFTFENALGVVF